MIYLWYGTEIEANGWELPGRIERSFNEDTKQVTDDYGHVHLITKRNLARNVIRARLVLPHGCLDDLAGPAADVPLRKYLLKGYRDKTKQLIFDEDQQYYYQAYLTGLDEAVSSNQQFFDNPPKYTTSELLVVEDGQWGEWLNLASLAEYPRM